MHLNFNKLYNSLLKEAILSQSEFIKKLSDNKPDITDQSSDKLLYALLSLAKEKELLSLTGKQNKKARKKVENDIEDEIKKLSSISGTSFSIKNIKKLYDSLIKFIEKKADVSVDLCLQNANYFINYIYPNLRDEDKALIDKGDYDFENVFKIVNSEKDSEKEEITKLATPEVVDIYEDDIVKIVYPMSNKSFNQYIKENLPPGESISWCTQDPKVWSNYSSRMYVAIAYNKDAHLTDDQYGLISLKIRFDGTIDEYATCNLYNEHLNSEDIEDAGISKEAANAASYFASNQNKLFKAYLEKQIKKLDFYYLSNNVEGFCSSVIYVNSAASAAQERDPVMGSKIQNYVIDFIEERIDDSKFFANAIVDLAAFFEHERVDDNELYVYITSLAEKSINAREKSELQEKICDYLYKKASNSRSHNQYMLLYLDNALLASRKDLEKVVLASLHTNNVRTATVCLEKIASNYKQNFLLRCDNRFKEYPDEETKSSDEAFVKELFLSKAFSNYIKTKGYDINFANSDFRHKYQFNNIIEKYKDILKQNLKQIIKNANSISVAPNLKDVTITKEVIEDASIYKILNDNWNKITRDYAYDIEKFLEESEDLSYADGEKIDAKRILESGLVIDKLYRHGNIHVQLGAANLNRIFLKILENNKYRNIFEAFPKFIKKMEENNIVLIKNISEYVYFKYPSDYFLLNQMLEIIQAIGSDILVNRLKKEIENIILNLEEDKLEIVLDNMSRYNNEKDNPIVEYYFEVVNKNINKFFNALTNLDYFTGNNKKSFSALGIHMKIREIEETNFLEQFESYLKYISQNAVIENTQKLLHFILLSMSTKLFLNLDVASSFIEKETEKTVNLYLDILLGNSKDFSEYSEIKLLKILKYLGDKVLPKITKSYVIKNQTFVKNINDLAKQIISNKLNNYIAVKQLYSGQNKEGVNISREIKKLFEIVLKFYPLDKKNVTTAILNNQSSLSALFDKERVEYLILTNLLCLGTDGQSQLLSKEDFTKIEKLLKNKAFNNMFNKLADAELKNAFAQTLFKSNVYISASLVFKLGIKDQYKNIVREAKIRKIISKILNS